MVQSGRPLLSPVVYLYFVGPPASGLGPEAGGRGGLNDKWNWAVRFLTHQLYSHNSVMAGVCMLKVCPSVCEF